MMNKARGRSPQEQLVSLSHAARMLGVSTKTIHSWCRRGLLHPTYKAVRGGRHFPMHEISALAEIIHQKMDLGDVATIATRALVTAKANERRLNELFQLLGLKRKALDTTPHEVLSLYEQALQRLDFSPQPTIQELDDWAATFYGMDEEYLRLVSKYTASPEPWKVFLDLAAKLAGNRAFECFDAMPELKAAYSHLEAGRRHLRMAAYLLCRQMHGVTKTNDLFGKETVTDTLLAVMFPD